MHGTAEIAARARAWLIVVALGPGCGGEGLADPLWRVQAAPVSNTLVAVGPGLGIGSSSIYAEGEADGGDRVFLRLDGTAWLREQPDVKSCLTCRTPRSVMLAGSDGGPGATLTVGPSGVVQRFHAGGTGWTDEATGLQGDLLALWGLDVDTVVAVGDGGGIARFDGQSWKPMDSPTRQPLRAVFGSATTDVTAVGDQGTLVRYDGTAWTLEPSGTIRGLRDVWGSPPLGYFAVGEGGLILHRRTR